ALGLPMVCTLQIDAASLIAASVMAAPCALAMSKLVYPEVEESKFKGKAKQNILEAASNGAAASVGLVANIAANLIAFLAVLEFINSALRWFGEMVDIEGLSFQVICSYVFMPVAFLMGADWADSPLVAELLGIKIFLNEFVAYQQLATYKKNRLSGLEEWDGSRKQWISVRAENIATFALCGFANLGSIGIMLGGLSSMVPQRKGDLASVVLRALLTGCCVSMLNACLAGRSLPTASGATKNQGRGGDTHRQRAEDPYKCRCSNGDSWPVLPMALPGPPNPLLSPHGFARGCPSPRAVLGPLTLIWAGMGTFQGQLLGHCKESWGRGGMAHGTCKHSPRYRT
uniref:Concentrative nucleoside transporter C-terminal domain-containing protein n=1 Tax=Buteo japonicus TaxID=224669 RepID=A0A8B9Z5Y3_9AVES